MQKDIDVCLIGRRESVCVYIRLRYTCVHIRTEISVAQIFACRCQRLHFFLPFAFAAVTQSDDKRVEMLKINVTR